MTTGYLTVQDLVMLKIAFDGAKVTSDQLKDLIDADRTSDYKVKMLEGRDYYDSKHAILEYKPYYYVDAVKVEDEAKSNITVPHPFHRILVNQKAAYVVGNPVVVSVDEEAADAEAIETELLPFIDDKFVDFTNEWAIGAGNKGVEWCHFYITSVKDDGVGGKLRYTIIPAEEIIPVYDSQYQDDLVAVIRYYEFEAVDAEGETVTRLKVEWWTKTGVEYWTETDEDVFVHDPDKDPNPRGHWSNVNSLMGKSEQASWGRVPFVPLYNNGQGSTDLEPIKAIIDAYDQVKSGWVNDLVDFQELIYVLKGYAPLTAEIAQGVTELGAFMKTLKTHKVISVQEGGAVETLKAEIPIEAKEKFLAISRREIFFFGEGVDVANEEFNAPSGIALKFLYSGLDLKANRLIRKFKVALGEFFWFVIEYLNRSERKTYDPAAIAFTFNKSMIFNETEKIAALAASVDILSRQTILENHPYVDDAVEEMERLEAERKEREKQGAVDLGEVNPNEPEPGATE